ncbi:hypothetical protein TSUD_179140 [Trifolium subterraneum]|uniref:Uncharacterized protein n=1 Tax=Trifolium subterraneum TaxID=3900 RepID=A0A2Z6ME58_TRISU|nr:hypothetical protein TSUD_179140 [Trifolium subterraneum]
MEVLHIMTTIIMLVEEVNATMPQYLPIVITFMEQISLPNTSLPPILHGYQYKRRMYEKMSPTYTSTAQNYKVD